MKLTTIALCLLVTTARAQTTWEIRAGYGTKYSRPIISTGFQYHFNEYFNAGPDLVVDVAQEAPASIGAKIGFTKRFIEIGPAIYWQMYGQSANTIKNSPNKLVYSGFIKKAFNIKNTKLFVQYQYLDSHHLTIGVKEFL